MKILHTIAQLPSRTGSGVYYTNVIEELKKYGHSQAAIFACQDGFEFTALEKESQYPVHFKSAGLPFPIAGMSDVMPYDNTRYSMMNGDMLSEWKNAFTEALLLAKSDFAPDVVILHHLWILTSMAAEIFDCRKIGVCHNTDIRQAEQNPAMKSAHVANLGKLDMVFSLSDSQKQRITDVFGTEENRLVTIGGGFSQNIFYPPAKKEKSSQINLVYSAKIEKSKGVFELVKAFKKAAETHPNIHLDIIGTPSRENADLLASLIGNAANIAILPIKDQKTLAEYIRNKDIFVMPSYFEGLGLMAIECLASGLLVVATETEGLIGLLGDEVNNSGVIEYVKLPRIYDTDKPYEEDIGEFVENLAAKLIIQIERAKKSEPIPKEIESAINSHSWKGVVERINQIIQT